MIARPPAPDDPLAFIQGCVRGGRIVWTYHVGMRLHSRGINRDVILASVDIFEIIESYPDDKYFPSYLVYAKHDGDILHVLFATDVIDDNVRVITAYRPDPAQWDAAMKRRIAP